MLTTAPAMNNPDFPLTEQHPGLEPSLRMSVLVIDEDAAVRSACCEIALKQGFVSHGVPHLAEARELLRGNSIDIILLDLKGPGSPGLELLDEIKSLHPETAVIVMTAFATVTSAVEAMRTGAADYLTKPFALDELAAVLECASERRTLDLASRRLRDKLRTQQGLGNIIGRSAEMDKIYRILSKVAFTSHPVLILGDSGTGKEMVARAIHANGPNAAKPFIPVDCGSLVPTLIESELFGYVKGAFTGAQHAKDGLLAIAEGGTVFLDEVGELPIDLQAKLLRAIQEREIRPVGSTKQIPINVRILAATNRDLEEGVAQGPFRRALYYRLNVLSLRIPSLRERRQDIPILASHFLERLSRDSGQERVLSDEALKAMLAYDWPGNVRELENCLERACAFTTGPMIHLGDLPAEISQLRTGLSGGDGNGSNKIIPMSELERQTILATIAQLNGDKLLAARMLGIGKTTLYRKLKEYSSQS